MTTSWIILNHKSKSVMFWLIVSCSLVASGGIWGFGVGELYLRICEKTVSTPSLPVKTPSLEIHLRNVTDLQKYILQAPQNYKTVDVFLFLQNHYLQTGQLAKSKMLFAYIHKCLPGICYHFAALEFAKLLQQHHRDIYAVQILQALQKQSLWVAPEVISALGNFAYRQNRLQSAKEYWELLRCRFPDTKCAKNICGLLGLIQRDLCGRIDKDLQIPCVAYLCKQNKYKQALNVIKNRQDDTAMYYRIKILNSTKDYTQAIQYARSFINQYSQSQWLEPVMLNLAYNLWRRKKHLSAAQSCYQSLLHRFPQSKYLADIRVALSEIQTALNNSKDKHGPS